MTKTNGEEDGGRATDARQRSLEKNKTVGGRQEFILPANTVRPRSSTKLSSHVGGKEAAKKPKKPMWNAGTNVDSKKTPAEIIRERKHQ